jgi:hypothetical protein
MSELRFPGPVVAGKFVDENDSAACPDLFVIKLGAVKRLDVGHSVS